jgi:competence transcription factor ComK
MASINIGKDIELGFITGITIKEPIVVTPTEDTFIVTEVAEDNLVTEVAEDLLIT